MSLKQARKRKMKFINSPYEIHLNDLIFES